MKELLNQLADSLGWWVWYWTLAISLIVTVTKVVTKLSRRYLTTEKENDHGLKGFIGTLRKLSSVSDYYHRVLGGCLRFLDRRLDEPCTASLPDASLTGIGRWFGSNPWTGGLYDFCLKLAVFYPIFALLGFWIFADQGMLGEVVFLEPSPWEQRAVTFTGMVLTIGLFVYSKRRQVWWSWLAFAVAGAVAGAFLYEWLLNQYPKISPVVRGIFWWVVLIAYAGLLYQLGEQSNEGSNALLLFLGVLPLLNAPLDWLSLGLTRGLLRAVFWRVGSWYVRLGISVVDLVIAFSLIFGLVAVVIAGVSALNYFAIAGGGRTLIDLPKTLMAIRTNPTDSAHYWVYFLFFSTLVPTVIHLVAGLFGVFAALGEALESLVDKVIELRKEGGIDEIATL